MQDGKTTRWIENRYFFVRDAYEKEIVHFQHIDGKENPADGFTKALDENNFRLFQQRIGIRELDVSIVGIEPTGEDANTGIRLLICQFEFKRKPVSSNFRQWASRKGVC